jgi:hypothetical protein
MSTTTVKRKVLGVDVYLWTTPIEGDLRGRRERHTAERGDVIEVSQEEADRGESIVDKDGPFLGPVDAAVPNTSGDFAPVDDAAIEAMSVAEVTAYLNTVPEDQSDDELERVLSLENGRSKPRVGVLALDPDFEPDPDADLNA